MPKDYYWILRVDRAADASQIKDAYRRIAKESHPDTAGSEKSAERFLEVKEAYETLANEEKRRKYDEELAKEEPCFENHRRCAGSGEDGFRMTGKEESFSWMDDISHGLWEVLFDRQSENDLYFEAILSPREAQRGGFYPVSLDVLEPCPRCGNHPSRRLFCDRCFGTGKIESRRRLPLNIPPRVKAGTRLRVALKNSFANPVYVNIIIRIATSLNSSF